MREDAGEQFIHQAVREADTSTVSARRQLWCQILDSGRVPQGRRRLRKPARLWASRDEFCCLGVACELAVAAGVIEREFHGGRVNPYWYGGKSGTTDTVLPREVVAWLGVDESSPSVRFGPRKTKLATLNDGGVSFYIISDLIREMPICDEQESETTA